MTLLVNDSKQNNMKKYLFCLAAVLAIVAACEKPGNDPAITPILDVNTSAIDALATEKDYMKSVTCNCDWTAEVTVGSEWISVSPTVDNGTSKRKKTLTVHVSANTSDDVRHGEISISNGYTVLTIAVNQASASSSGSDDPSYAEYDASKPTHLAWNFHVLKDEKGNDYNHSTNYTSLRGSKYDYSWSAEARYPAPSDDDSFNCINNRLLPTEANHEKPLEAYLSVCDYGKQHVPAASGKSVSPTSIEANGGLSLNPSIQVQMLKANDFIYVSIPVKNLTATTQVKFGSSVAGAASAAGFFVLEYSVNFNESTYEGDWFKAPGGYVYKEGGNPAYGFVGTSTLAGCAGDTYHFWNTYYNQRSTSKDENGHRYVYTLDKSVDDGLDFYTFALSEISPVAEGRLYLRMRSFYGLKANEGEKATSGGWTDFKFVDVVINNN